MNEQELEQPLHQIEVVNQLAKKLNIPMTNELLLMSNTDEISEKLISIAMENGTDAKTIDKALDSVKDKWVLIISII